MVEDENYRIDTREQLHNVPHQSVITQDNVMMTVSAIVYYKIVDPYQAVYAVQNLPQAVVSLTQTVLRNKIGQMYLDKTLTARKEINEELKNVLDEATKPWGILMTRFELQSVCPPSDIQHAMELQMSAERNRRASILDAEGAKRGAILRAEGERDSAMIKAEGEKQSAIIKAEGEAEALKKTIEAEAISLERISKAIGGDAARYMLAQKYLLTLPEVTKGEKGKTVVIPYDTASLSSLTNIIHEVAGKKES